MATRTLGARVQLAGEKEFKAAIQNIDAGTRTLQSELKRLQAEFKNNTQSMTYLTEKGDILSRSLAQQSEKSKMYQDMLAKASEAYAKAVERVAEAEKEGGKALAAAQKQLADADLKVQKYTQSLNYSEAKEFELKHSIEEVNAAMQEADAVTSKMSNQIEELASKLGIQIPSGARKALDAMSGLSSGGVVALAALGAAVAATGKAVKEMYDATVQAAAEADELLTKSMTSGLSTDLLQQLKYAENLIDVSVSTITDSLTHLTKNMDKARDGNADLAKSFSDLGIQITSQDGALRSAEEVFNEVIEVLRAMDNETERNAAGMELLGKNVQDLAPLYKQGSATLQEYLDAAKANYVLTEEQIEVLGKLDDQVQINKLAWEALENQLAARFAPAATEALTNFTELVEAAGKALLDSGVIEGVGELFVALASMITPLTEIFKVVDQAEGALRPVAELCHGLAGDIAWIKDGLNASIGFLTYLTPAGRQKWNTALGYNAQYGQYSNMQKWNGTAAVMDAQLSGYSEYGGKSMAGYGYDPATGLYYDKNTGNYIFGNNAAGNDNWRGGLTWVGEAGPELVNLPKGTQIMSAQESRNQGAVYIENFNATIDAQSVKDFTDIVDLVKSAQIRARMR